MRCAVPGKAWWSCTQVRGKWSSSCSWGFQGLQYRWLPESVRRNSQRWRVANHAQFGSSPIGRARSRAMRRASVPPGQVVVFRAYHKSPQTLDLTGAGSRISKYKQSALPGIHRRPLIGSARRSVGQVRIEAGDQHKNGEQTGDQP
jgi:hypothetical protein